MSDKTPITRKPVTKESNLPKGYKPPDPKKQKIINDALEAINKQHGKGSIMRLGDGEISGITNTLSTGIMGLDYILGNNGLARGRIVEIYGPESSGKTTLALHIIAQAQKQGGICAFIDAEHALDVTYAKKLGVAVDDLLLSQPDAGEQALEITESLVKSGAAEVVVIDSVASLTPKAEIEGDYGDSHVGLQARMMSQALRKIASIVSKSNTVLIFINQVRIKIGVMYGNPEVTSGGNALKFWASYRLDIRPKGGKIEEGENQIGHYVNVKTVKNKLYPPFKTVNVAVVFGRGVCPFFETIKLGVHFNVIEKSGSWYSYKETRLGQGEKNAAEFLMGSYDLYNEIREKVREQVCR